MAASTLTQASENEILKIFQVVASKTIRSVDSLVKSTQPKLNVLIADTIDAFKTSPQRIDKVMDLLIARMRHLGMSVDELTKGMTKIPKGMQSLQDALRAREQKSIKAEREVQELRKQGIAAEVRQNKAHIITQTEMKKYDENFKNRQEKIVERNQKVFKDSQKLEKLSTSKRVIEEERIIKERGAIVKAELKLVEDKEKKKGRPGDEIRGGDGPGGELIDPRGMFAPIVDQFMGIKDSIIGPFQEIGAMGMRVGKSLKNFGKAMLTPIKSIKRFGATMMVSLLPMLGWALLIVVLVAVVAMIIFKFKAIAAWVKDWWAGFKITLSKWWEGVKDIGIAIKDWIMNIPTMLGEAMDSTIEFIGGIGTRIWDALGDALESAKNFIMDGFRKVMNGVITLLNELPFVNIDLLKTSDEIKSAKVAEADATEGTKFMQNQWKSVDSGVKTSLKIDDTDKTDISQLKESIAPDGKVAGVIVQDNKTINNSQSNAESVVVAKADKNPEPASKWENLHEFTGA